MHLSLLNFLIVVAFAAPVLFAGWWAWRNATNSDDYVAAGPHRRRAVLDASPANQIRFITLTAANVGSNVD